MVSTRKLTSAAVERAKFAEKVLTTGYTEKLNVRSHETYL